MYRTWDERKNRSNKAKHGVSFETAMVVVFEDPYHLSRPDREVEDEVRWQTIIQTIGALSALHVLLVVHTGSEPDEHGEETIRIISVRKATPSERSTYAQGF
ncbi:MAG TPA: BrnT family toxin [Terriglobia bacterium]|nr:BrnT family toxin [Terriglobia bacterium]